MHFSNVELMVKMQELIWIGIKLLVLFVHDQVKRVQRIPTFQVKTVINFMHKAKFERLLFFLGYYEAIYHPYKKYHFYSFNSQNNVSINVLHMKGELISNVLLIYQFHTINCVCLLFIYLIVDVILFLAKFYGSLWSLLKCNIYYISMVY